MTIDEASCRARRRVGRLARLCRLGSAARAVEGRGRYALATAAVVALLAAGRAAADGVLQIGSPGSPASLDPHKITGVWENRIVGDMLVGLTTEGPDGTIVPGAAERWEVSGDGLEYRFTLRPHEWSDGRPVTATDFEYSLKRMLAPATASPYADFFFMIEGARAFTTGEGAVDDVGVRALDDHTLVIELTRPTAYFTGLLMHFAAFPVPRHVVESAGNDWTDTERMVVNGPFVLDERVPNAFVALRRNVHFYGADEVRLDGVVHHVQEDRSAAVQRFRSGEFHIVRDFPSGRAAFLREVLPEGTVRTTPFLGLAFFAVNHRRPVLRERPVRRALALALQRDVIAEQVLGSGERPALGLVPPGTDNYGEPARYGFADWSLARRLDAAREALEDAGYGPGRPLRLGLRYGISENERRVAIAAQAMWKQVGIEVDLESAETAVHYARLSEGDFDLGLANWLAVYSDPQTFTLLLESQTGPNNFGAYENPRYDALTAEARTAVDVDQRAALLRRAEALALEDHGLIPIYHHAARNLVSRAVVGWDDNVLNVQRSRYLGLEAQ